MATIMLVAAYPPIICGRLCVRMCLSIRVRRPPGAPLPSSGGSASGLNADESSDCIRDGGGSATE
jgi:hypothetical protein